MPRLKPPTARCLFCDEPVTRQDGRCVHWNNGRLDDEAAGHAAASNLETVPLIICGHHVDDPESPTKVVFVA